MDIRSPQGFGPAFQEARKASVDGVLDLGGPLLSSHAKQTRLNLAAKNRLPGYVGAAADLWKRVASCSTGWTRPI